MAANSIQDPCTIVKNEIAKYSGWDVNIMVAIAKAENSTCDSNRHNLTTSETHRDASGNIICIGSYGVLQVGCLHYKATDNRNDLATNIRIAKQAFDNREKWGIGYEAWSTYNNGAYKKYMQ